LGDSAPSQFEAQLKTYLRSGFRDFKIKLSGDWKRDLSKTHALLASGIDPYGVRADANNLWQSADAAIAHLKAIGYPFSAIEEPCRQVILTVCAVSLRRSIPDST
jgi:L-alanine-DL-glutamate epimerase-like enolase superfamily enzyme